ncbi:MAG TPA: hypothetical protein DHV60_02105 [Verrucomicrobiales bacterium]|nr:hypothetical protein [Verrucomicrobiales bacterium]
MSEQALNNVGQVDELLTKTELAKRLKVTTRSIDNWVRDGLLPKVKICNTCRFNWLSVCDAINATGKEQS